MATCRISESEGLAFLEADPRWFLWEIDDFIMVNSFSQTGVWSDDEPLTLVPEEEILISSAIIISLAYSCHWLVCYQYTLDELQEGAALRASHWSSTSQSWKKTLQLIIREDWGQQDLFTVIHPDPHQLYLLKYLFSKQRHTRTPLQAHNSQRAIREVLTFIHLFQRVQASHNVLMDKVHFQPN